MCTEYNILNSQLKIKKYIGIYIKHTLEISALEMDFFLLNSQRFRITYSHILLCIKICSTSVVIASYLYISIFLSYFVCV